jgi:hypothetical protein
VSVQFFIESYATHIATPVEHGMFSLAWSRESDETFVGIKPVLTTQYSARVTRQPFVLELNRQQVCSPSHLDHIGCSCLWLNSCEKRREQCMCLVVMFTLLESPPNVVQFKGLKVQTLQTEVPALVRGYSTIHRNNEGMHKHVKQNFLALGTSLLYLQYCHHKCQTMSFNFNHDQTAFTNGR